MDEFAKKLTLLFAEDNALLLGDGEGNLFMLQLEKPMKGNKHLLNFVVIDQPLPAIPLTEKLTDTFPLKTDQVMLTRYHIGLSNGKDRFVYVGFAPKAKKWLLDT